MRERGPMGRVLFRYRVAVIAAFFAVAILAAYASYQRADALPSWLASTTSLTSHEIAFAVCGVMSIVAFWLRAAGEARLGSVVYGQGAGVRVVTSGPFRVTRNPLYVGVVLFFVATAAPYASPVVVVILTIGLGLALRSIAIYEEGTLLTALGEPYARYVAAVPRFLGVPRAVDDDGIKTTAGAWLYATAGNVGILTLGCYRLLDASGVMFRGMKLINVALFCVWIAIVLGRRLLAK